MKSVSAWKEVIKFIIWALFSNTRTAIPTITGIVIFLCIIIFRIIKNKSSRCSERIKERKK